MLQGSSSVFGYWPGDTCSFRRRIPCTSPHRCWQAKAADEDRRGCTEGPGRTVESEILLCLILLFYRGLLIWALPRCTSMHCHTHVGAPWQGPNSIPYQYPEELLASSYCNAFYRQRVWVCEASNKTLQVKTKHYQIADNSTKTNVVSGVCSPLPPLSARKMHFSTFMF